MSNQIFDAKSLLFHIMHNANRKRNNKIKNTLKLTFTIFAVRFYPRDETNTMVDGY